MNGKQGKIALAMLIVLAGGSSCIMGAEAFTVNTVTEVEPPASGAINTVFGWTFEVTGSSNIFVTHVGVYDHEVSPGDGLLSNHEIGIWRGADLLATATVPAGIETECVGGYRYVELDTPQELQPGVHTIGVLFPGDNADWFLEWADVSFDSTGTVVPWSSTTYPGWYSRKSPSSTLIRPGTGSGASVTQDQQGLNVNFRYELPTPVAEAGPDVTIYSSQQGADDTGEPFTTILGTATDPYPGPESLTYRWLVDGILLQDWLDVGVGDEANLGLAPPVPAFAIGTHILTLEVKDGAFTVSDTMTLTVENTPPEAQPAPTSQAVEVYVDAIIIAAEVADFDGDTLSYEWRKDGEVLDSGVVTPPAGGAEIPVADLVIPAGDPSFPVGLNEVEFVVSDGVNEPLVVTATVDVQDTMAPTLCPIPSRIILRPPDGQLKPVTIWANAFDRGGGPTTLGVTVESTRPPEPGETDYYIDSIDNDTGVIHLRLRAERRRPGLGRIYKITVTASDLGGNSSSAKLFILAPRRGPWFKWGD